MRLIDADALINDTKQFCGKNEMEWTTNKVLTWIDSQPTAYDPDEVVEELEEAKRKPNLYVYAVDAYYKAIEIVRKGGV